VAVYKYLATDVKSVIVSVDLLQRAKDNELEYQRHGKEGDEKYNVVVFVDKLELSALQ
jgi:hypothetical protein